MTLRPRQRLGKYRIERRLGTGAFADVFQAFDTIEHIRVAVKVPLVRQLGPEGLADILKEVRLTAQLDHPNILSIKDANRIDGRFVVVQPLGDCNLDDRLRRRLAFTTLLSYAEQLLSALEHAHEMGLAHCDVKPENIILFGRDHLRLADFGLARLALRTIVASGSGTVGYMAPEQAMGKPSLRSDVFSAGLIIYRMLSGKLPDWPFKWPPPGYAKARRKAHSDLLDLLRRAMDIDSRRRPADAGVMLRSFRRLLPRVKRFHQRRLRG